MLPAQRIKPPEAVVLIPEVEPPPDCEISKLFTRFVGALIPITLAPLLEIVMFGPADSVSVPVLEPPGTDMMFPPPPDGLGPMTVMPPAEDDKVMFDPAARRIGPDATVVVPEVAPPAVIDEMPKSLTALPVVEK